MLTSLTRHFYQDTLRIWAIIGIMLGAFCLSACIADPVVKPRVLIVTTDQQTPPMYAAENGQSITADLVGAGIPFDAVTHGRFVEMDLQNHDIIFICGHTTPTKVSDVADKCEAAIAAGKKIFIYGNLPYRRYDSSGDSVEYLNYAPRLFPVGPPIGKKLTGNIVVPKEIEKDPFITAMGFNNSGCVTYTLKSPPLLSLTCNGDAFGFLYPQGGLIDDAAPVSINSLDYGRVVAFYRYGNAAVVGFATDRIEGKHVVSFEVHCDHTMHIVDIQNVNQASVDYGVPLACLLVYKNLVGDSIDEWNRVAATNPLIRIGSHSRTHPTDWSILSDEEVYSQTVGALNDQRLLVPATGNYMNFSGWMNPTSHHMDMMYEWDFIYGGGGGGGGDMRRIKTADGKYIHVQITPTRKQWLQDGSKANIAPICCSQTMTCDFISWSNGINWTDQIKLDFDANVKYGLYSYTFFHDYAMNPDHDYFTDGLHLMYQVRAALEYISSQDVKYLFTDDLILMLRDFMKGWTDYTVKPDGGLTVNAFRPDAKINQIKVQARNGLAPVASGESVVSQHRIGRMLYVDLKPETMSTVDISWVAVPPNAPAVDAPSCVACSFTAGWTLEDEISTVTEFQYALGTEPGGTDVVDWTSNGTEESVSLDSLELENGKTYYLSVKATNEHDLWSEPGVSEPILADRTAPTTPSVSVETIGSESMETILIKAIWSSDDPESGIASYRYAVGSAPGDDDIVEWIDVGTDTEVTVNASDLGLGATRYFAVQAKNNVGLWSEVGVSDNVVIPTVSVWGAKLCPDGCAVGTGIVQVTAVFDDGIYVEQLNRASGIRVVVDYPVSIGRNLYISGRLNSCEGERFIENAIAQPVPPGSDTTALVKPLAMTIRSIGGGYFGAHTKGVCGRQGLHNIGLLAIVCGRVSSTGSGCFYVADGSITTEDHEPCAIKVKCPGLILPEKDDVVRVTGIITTELNGDTVIAVIRPRYQLDIFDCLRSPDEDY